MQVKDGRFDTLVNKFLGLSRLYGLAFVFSMAFDLLFLRKNVLDEEKEFYCSVVLFSRDFLSLCFWSNQLIIALFRSKVHKKRLIIAENP